MNKFIEKTMLFVLSDGDPKYCYEQLLEANPMTIANDIIPTRNNFEYDTVGDVLETVEGLAKDFEDVYNEGYHNGQSDAHSSFQDEVSYRGWS